MLHYYMLLGLWNCGSLRHNHQFHFLADHFLPHSLRPCAPHLHGSHLCIALLALVAMCVGVTSSVCAIMESEHAICALTVPSAP